MTNTPEETQKILDWAVEQLELRQQSKLYGRVTFIFENGRIVRSTTEESCVAPKVYK